METTTPRPPCPGCHGTTVQVDAYGVEHTCSACKGTGDLYVPAMAHGREVPTLANASRRFRGTPS